MPCLTVEWSHRVGSKLFPHSASQLKSTILHHRDHGPNGRRSSADSRQVTLSGNLATDAQHLGAAIEARLEGFGATSRSDL